MSSVTATLISRVTLQTLAKTYSIKANLKSSEIEALLLAKGVDLTQYQHAPAVPACVVSASNTTMVAVANAVNNKKIIPENDENQGIVLLKSTNNKNKKQDELLKKSTTSAAVTTKQKLGLRPKTDTNIMMNTTTATNQPRRPSTPQRIVQVVVPTTSNTTKPTTPTQPTTTTTITTTIKPTSPIITYQLSSTTSNYLASLMNIQYQLKSDIQTIRNQKQELIQQYDLYDNENLLLYKQLQSFVDFSHEIHEFVQSI
jgi:hypothetical protein